MLLIQHYEVQKRKVKKSKSSDIQNQVCHKYKPYAYQTASPADTLQYGK